MSRESKIIKMINKALKNAEAYSENELAYMEEQLRVFKKLKKQSVIQEIRDLES